MEAAHEYRTLLACDIAASSGRTAEDLQRIRQLLESACRGAFHAGGLKWDSSARSPRSRRTAHTSTARHQNDVAGR